MVLLLVQGNEMLAEYKANENNMIKEAAFFKAFERQTYTVQEGFYSVVCR